jgi:predicted MFS family arabinose efflux permease
VLTVARLAGNTLFRSTGPFLPVIGRDLGVSLQTMGAAVSAGELAGLAAPAVGRRIDRADRRNAMLVGGLFLAVTAALAATSPSVAVFAAALVGIAVAKLALDAATMAWIADRVDYSLRSRVMGLAELSWAGAMLVGIPLLGLVVAATSWRVAYGVMAVLNLAMVAAVATLVTPDPASLPASEGRLRWDVLRASMPVYIAFGALLTASTTVFVVFGVWMEDAYGLSIAGIGGVSLLLGLAEALATTTTIRLTDRIGKRRAVIVGAALMVPAALAFAVVGGSVVAGVATLVVFVLGFEFAIVSVLPLLTELHPEARASSLGLAVAAGTVGRAGGALATTALYARYGMGASGAVAALCGVAVVAVFAVAVREPASVGT